MQRLGIGIGTHSFKILPCRLNHLHSSADSDDIVLAVVLIPRQGRARGKHGVTPREQTRARPKDQYSKPQAWILFYYLGRTGPGA